MAGVQAVALYGSELWWDPKEVGRKDDLQLLLDRQARCIVGALPTTPWGALLRDSGLTPAPNNLRLQSTAICSETSKRVQQQGKEATPKPLFRGTDIQSSQERA